MNHRKKVLPYLLLTMASVIFTTSARAQQISFYDSGELIRKGAAEHDKGNYKKARDYFDKVPEGDTNYLWALSEKALTCMADSSFAESIALGQKAIKAGYSDRHQVMLNMAAAYDYTGNEEESVRLYDSASVLYPHDYKPWFERGVIFFRKNEYDKAERFLQESLMRNPYHFRSHFMLGSIYTLEGRLTEAIAALQVSLICTNDRDVAQKSIKLLSSLATQTDEVSGYYGDKKPEYANPDYDETNEIVHAKLALDKGYTLKTAIDDNIIRQLQVVLEKLRYNSRDSGFVMQYYVPLLKEVYEKDQFEPYVLLLFSEYGIQAVDKIASGRKGKAQLEEIRNIVFPYLGHIQATRVLPFEKRQKAEALYHLYPKDQLLAAGKYGDEAKHQFAAGFVQWYREQALVAEGNYNATGHKDGTWNYYYLNGRPKLKEEYNDGKLKSESVAWYYNGNISNKAKHNNEGAATERYDYEYNGRQESAGVLKGKEEYQVTYYHPDGTTERIINVVNDKIKDGNYTIFYPNGKVQKEMTYKDTKLNGSYKTYYEDGSPKETYTCKEDMIDGLFQSFFPNGKPKAKYTYVAGSKQDTAEDYYESGQLYTRQEFSKGKANGSLTYYDRSGRAFGNLTYRDNLVVAARYTAPDGKVVYEKEDQKGISPLEYYNVYGNRVATLFQDAKGDVQGKKTRYYYSGITREETEYKDDEPEGNSVMYYKNGKPEARRQYKGGRSEGYYEYYNSSGQLKTEGWLKNGLGQGVWHNYSDNGKLARDFFMLDDELNGPEKNYELNGKPDYTRIYDRGMIIGLIQYDSSGKIIQEVTFDKGNGTYRMLCFNGKPAMQCALKYGRFEGPYTILSPEGKLLEKGTYAAGEKEGGSETYYPNGKLRLKGSYKNGKKTGTWTFYREDGATENETGYKEDMQEGSDKFYAGGQLRYETLYHEGNKQQSTLYGEEGKRAGVLYYDNGYLTGYTYEDKDGKLLPVVPSDKGTADIKTSYADGAKAMDFHYVLNCYEGSQKLYYHNGKLAEERFFTGDDFNGAYNRFNPDGSKWQEATFKNDIQQGTENKYNKNGRLIFTVVYADGQPNGAAKMTDSTGSGMIGLWYYYGTLQ